MGRRPRGGRRLLARFDKAVRPKLDGTGGFIDATVERVGDEDRPIEIVVVTRWTS